MIRIPANCFRGTGDMWSWRHYAAKSPASIHFHQHNSTKPCLTTVCVTHLSRPRWNKDYHVPKEQIVHFYR